VNVPTIGASMEKTIFNERSQHALTYRGRNAEQS
jgi:hypothetical protein